MAELKRPSIGSLRRRYPLPKLSTGSIGNRKCFLASDPYLDQLVRVVEHCDGSNGGCEHCPVEAMCVRLWDRRIAYKSLVPMSKGRHDSLSRELRRVLARVNNESFIDTH